MGDRKRQRIAAEEEAAAWKNGESSNLDNPYLAHLQPTKSASPKTLFPGISPNNSSAKACEKIEDGSVNPFNGQMFTERYFGILKQRRNLPVHQQRQEFLDWVRKHQMIVLVGETGSGKTTQ